MGSGLGEGKVESEVRREVILIEGGEYGEPSSGSVKSHRHHRGQKEGGPGSTFRRGV